MSKKIALMQPYLLPYLGYFQLIAAVDTFVCYDHAQYIKGGWINRNRILVNKQVQWLTLPVVREHFELPINQRKYNDLAQQWGKMLETLRHQYGRAKHFRAVFELLQSVQAFELSIAEFNALVLQKLAHYLGLNTRFLKASEVLPRIDALGQELAGQDYVIRCVQQCAGQVYINSVFGEELYDRQSFAEAGLQLQFLRPALFEYQQFSDTFQPSLSILDVMMHNPAERIAEHLHDYRLE